MKHHLHLSIQFFRFLGSGLKMYRVSSHSGAQWTIVNDHDQVMFVGTRLQCEDWLDWKENTQPKVSFGTSCRNVWSSFVSWLRGETRQTVCPSAEATHAFPPAFARSRTLRR